MRELTKKYIEELAAVKDKLCISIYISTHRKGMPVLNGEDRLTLKNELQKTRFQLAEQNYSESFIQDLLKPASDLLEDSGFWRNLDNCLGIFLSENFSSIETFPIEVETNTTIASEFIVSPMLPLINNHLQYFILNLNQDHIQLFKADRYGMTEVELDKEVMPIHLSDFMQYYDFQNLHEGRRKMGVSNHYFHGHKADKTDINYRYQIEFLKQVHRGISEKLAENTEPLVLAGSDNIVGMYREINKYHNIYPEGIHGIFQKQGFDELHKHSVELLSNYFEAPVQKTTEKYAALAGTGKTSYAINEIFQAASEGRIEAILYNRDQHLWASVNEKGKLVFSSNPHSDSIDLFNNIAIQTILNSGDAYPVEEGELNAEESPTGIAAIYRY